MVCCIDACLNLRSAHQAFRFTGHSVRVIEVWSRQSLTSSAQLGTAIGSLAFSKALIEKDLDTHAIVRDAYFFATPVICDVDSRLCEYKSQPRSQRRNSRSTMQGSMHRCPLNGISHGPYGELRIGTTSLPQVCQSLVITAQEPATRKVRRIHLGSRVSQCTKSIPRYVQLQSSRSGGVHERSPQSLSNQGGCYQTSNWLRRRSPVGIQRTAAPEVESGVHQERLCSTFLH